MKQQYSNRIHFSIKLTPKQASSKKNEEYVLRKLENKRKKVEPNFKDGNLVREADLGKTFSVGYTTNWSIILFKINANIIDTIPS